MHAIRYFGIFLVSFSQGIAFGIFSAWVSEIMSFKVSDVWAEIFLGAMLLTTCAFFLPIKRIADKRRYWLYGALIVLDFFIFELMAFVFSGFGSTWLIIFCFPAFLIGLIGGGVIVFSQTKWLTILAVFVSIIALIRWIIWLSHM